VIDDYLRRHDGVITLAQAEKAGLSRHAVNRRVRSGRWLTCSRGVYFADDRPFTDAARIRSAVWGRGPEAVASGLAAAWWHGVSTYPPDVVEVTVPRAARRVACDGVRTRRRDLSSADVVERRGLRVTELALTVVEAATRRGGGVKIVDTALQRHTDLRHLWTAHLRTRGRHGSPAARRLLHAAEGGAKSEAERLFKRLLTKAGITGWKANQRVAGYEVDFLFSAARVAVEIDGFAFHSASDDFQHDRIKQNAIALAGFQVLRFTWLDLNEYPERVLAEVRRAICGV
jgi:very-short-patch-repair endonuclease